MKKILLICFMGLPILGVCQIKTHNNKDTSFTVGSTIYIMQGEVIDSGRILIQWEVNLYDPSNIRNRLNIDNGFEYGPKGSLDSLIIITNKKINTLLPKAKEVSKSRELCIPLK